MPSRFGPGPVFAYERLVTSRRWQGYAIRALFVAGLLTGMAVVRFSGGSAWWAQATGPNQLAAIGRPTAIAIVGTQLALVLLIAPASTAGAICRDRASGALTLQLTTDLSAAEVVLGKLLARLLPVLGLVLCSLPVAILATLLGGADPDALVRASVATLAVAVLGGAAGLAMSVWAGKAQETLLVIFAAWAAWMLAGPTLRAFAPVPTWVDMLHPFFLVLAPFGVAGRGSWVDVLRFVAVVSAASALLIGLAIASIRPAERRGAGPRRARPAGLGRGRGLNIGPIGRLLRLRPGFAPGPSLDADPVLWREWHRNRPSRWGRAVWWAFGLASAAYTVLAMAMMTGVPGGTRPPMFAVFGIAFQASIGLLLLAVSASASMAEERARGSLDVLLASPLRSSAIVRGKWLGAAQPLPWIALPTVLVPASEAIRSGSWAGVLFIVAMMLAFGAAFVSLGIALATLLRRPDRAVTLTVLLYLVPTVAWFFIILFRWGEGGVGGQLLLGSAFYGAAVGLYHAFPDAVQILDMGTMRAAMIAWVAAYALAAGLLLAITLHRFDRSLGRMPERSRSRTVGRPGRPRSRQATRAASRSSPLGDEADQSGTRYGA